MTDLCDRDEVALGILVILLGAALIAVGVLAWRNPDARLFRALRRLLPYPPEDGASGFMRATGMTLEKARRRQDATLRYMLPTVGGWWLVLGWLAIASSQCSLPHLGR